MRRFYAHLYNVNFERTVWKGGVALRRNTSHKIQLVIHLGFHFCVLCTQKTLYLGAYAPGAAASF